VTTDASFAYRVTAGGVIETPGLDEAVQSGGAAMVWVHLDGNAAEALAWLAARSHLPDAAIEALQARETRPRATPMAAGAIVNLRGLATQADAEAGADLLASIRLWAEHGHVVTLSYRPQASLGDVRARMEAGCIRDPGDLIAALAETITERLDPQVGAVGDRLDDLESAFAAGRTDIRDALGDVRRAAVEYRRFLFPQRDALHRLVSPEFAWLADDDRTHIREAADRAQRMAEELDAVRDRAGVLASQMTDYRSDVANQRMLVLSIIAAVFLPLTFLTGLMGMNVGGLPLRGSTGFWAVVALCGTIAIGMRLWFRRRGWA
jgi:zinc transporter